jgi:acyl dehydratase
MEIGPDDHGKRCTQREETMWPRGAHPNQRSAASVRAIFPVDNRYFENFETGATFGYGCLLVEEAEIFEFVRRFGPRPIHLDVEHAVSGACGLIASGWHTCAMFTRLFANAYQST